MTSPETISKETLRIIDASLNRIGEGLRLLEDVARLLLNDAALTQQLKDTRHQIITSNLPLQQSLIAARDVTQDIGTNLELTQADVAKDLPLIIVANARRAQESLRTLEELAKIPPFISELDSENFKQARYQVYTLEQTLMAKLLRQDKLKLLSGLYFILDTDYLGERNYLTVAQQAIRGGAKTIQLRDKCSSMKDLLPVAQQLRTLCRDSNVLFIINDFLDLTLACDADGIHLGQEDLPIAPVRKLLPIDKIIGYSTHNMTQAQAAVSEGADYIAFGSIFPTKTKDSAIIVGLDNLRQVSNVISLPIVAIGGINSLNAAEVIAAGADSIAVISAILQAENVTEATQQIIESLRNEK